MERTLQNRSYYPSLDGIRGIAILLVLFYHNFSFLPISRYGWVGVDLFFVLSGFLITDILLAARHENHYLRNFYVRRVLRILPVYYLCIILFYFFAPYFVKLDEQYNYYSEHSWFLWTNTQNWLYILHQKPNDLLFFNHLWSLSIEEQFYLFWPLLILLIKKPGNLGIFLLLLLIAGILSRLWSWFYFGPGYLNFHFQFMTRIDGLCIGCLIAVWKTMNEKKLKRRVLTLCGTVLIIHAAFFIILTLIGSDFPHFNILGYTSIAAVFGLFIFYGIWGKGKFKRIILENTVLKRLGEISYGLYVYHWPLLFMMKLYFVEQLTSIGLSANLSYITVCLLAAILAIGLSWLSFRFFEKPILGLKKRLL